MSSEHGFENFDRSLQPVFFEKAKLKMGGIIRNGEGIYGPNVAARRDSVERIILRNDLGLTPDRYMAIAASTQGREGIHYIWSDGYLYSVVIRGRTQDFEGNPSNTVRSVINLGYMPEDSFDYATQIAKLLTRVPGRLNPDSARKLVDILS